MSASLGSVTVAYLAQGNIRIKSGDPAPCTIESAYGNDTALF